MYIHILLKKVPAPGSGRTSLEIREVVSESLKSQNQSEVAKGIKKINYYSSPSSFSILCLPRIENITKNKIIKPVITIIISSLLIS